jgi:phosphatidylglycerophosphate synthase
MPGGEPLTEGEQWARDALTRLLATGFSPPGVLRFLRASRQRSAEIRLARPALAAQSRRWMLAGAAGHVVAGAANRDLRRLRDGLAWWAVVAAMVDWHLGMLETEDGRPRGLAAADALTLGRAWLVPAVWHAPSAALVVAGAASDVLDGRLARRTGPTRAGRDLEGLVDSCFIAAALRGALDAGRIGRSPAAAELARLTVGTGYATAIWFGRAAPPSRAVTGAGRAATSARLGGLALALAGRRRLGETLLVGGSVASVALAARALTVSKRTRPSTGVTRDARTTRRLPDPGRPRDCGPPP